MKQYLHFMLHLLDACSEMNIVLNGSFWDVSWMEISSSI
jgi:hypothetical protein